MLKFAKMLSFFSNICKWLDSRIFSDKDVKPLGQFLDPLWGDFKNPHSSIIRSTVLIPIVFFFCSTEGIFNIKCMQVAVADDLGLSAVAIVHGCKAH